jgi:hypothetical protein
MGHKYASDSPEHRAWASMKGRCFNVRHQSYGNYGGRGITVYAPWVRSYDAFYRHVGARPGPEYSLDRYPDNNGNYEPGNVRWATRMEQRRNSRQNHILTLGQQTMPMVAWAEWQGMPWSTLDNRLRRGMSLAQALSTPVMTRAEVQQCAAWSRRQAAHCVNGHPFTPENTRIYGANWRRCLACEREANARKSTQRSAQRRLARGIRNGL